jgi:superfamily II DNA or RNA helicase
MLNLFDYQSGIIDLLREGFAAGHNPQMLVAPTGAGKTEMAIALLEAAAKKGTRAAMVVDRVALCDQTSQRLQKYGIAHGVMQAGHWRNRAYERIQVCSAQTLEKRGEFPGLKLLIVDEAHQTRKSIAEFIKRNPDVLVVGLSATPFTKGLGQIFPHVVSSVTTQELVNRKRLAPLKVFVAKEIDMVGAQKTSFGEWKESEVTERGLKITGDIVTEWVKKTHEVFNKPEKTIVFCAGVAHGADLQEKFQAAGYNFLSISYKDDDQFKIDAIAEFAKSDSTIQGLIATDILTKGFDVSDVKIGVSARPFSKSLSSHVQQMGRVMRSHEGKDFALWLDHSGNYLRFREDWDDVYENGVTELDDGREKAKKEPTAKEKSDQKCPKCSHLWPSASDTCPCCGFVRARKNSVLAVAGEMHELGQQKAKISEDKQAWFSQFIALGKIREYKPGWAYYQFIDKFGHDPKNMKYVEAAPTVEVHKWVTKNAKARAKQRLAA